jgi:hypothetical protein
MSACEQAINARVLLTGIAGCCARAASGHAAAAPPSSVMNSRLFIQSPRKPAVTLAGHQT